MAPMRILSGLVILCCAVFFLAVGERHALPLARAEDGTKRDKIETIVCIRHGEKPSASLGQLTCHGFNRALRLPRVLIGKFGKPERRRRPFGRNTFAEHLGG